MSGIYICYRRSDTAAVAELIYNNLAATFGRETIFKDIDVIPAGADFLSYIRATLGESSVVLVLIGPRWLLESDMAGRRRLDNPDDFVRFEIETAFAVGAIVIPLLIDTAPMPSPSELPPTLQPLTRLQALQVRTPPYFKNDVARLSQELTRFVRPAARQSSKRSNSWLSWIFGRSDTKIERYSQGSDSSEPFPPSSAPGLSPPNTWVSDMPGIGEESPKPPALISQPTQSSGGRGSVHGALPSIFISYKRTDRPVIAVLAMRLAELGYPTWFDQQLIGGQSWWDEILQQIQSADIFVFALTPDSLESVPCQREYSYAHALLKRILPVQLADAIDMRLLPPALQKIQSVDYCTADDAGWTQLKSALVNLPPAVDLPMVLPPPPPAPISPLGAIKEQIDQPEISIQDQAYILHELRTLLKGQDNADGAMQLLRQFFYHPDLRKTIADEIQTLLV